MEEAKQRPPGAKELADKIRLHIATRKKKEKEPDEPPKVVVLEDGSKIIHEYGGRKVTLSPDGTFVTKEGLRISPAEVEALSTAQRSGVPCPKPIGTAQSLDPQRNSYKMSFLPGEPLDQVWRAMSADEKSSIAIQLRDILDKMRTLEPPPNLVGGCAGTSFRHLRSFDFAESACSFKNEAEFNEWLLGGLFDMTPSPIREALRLSLRTDHRIVLTHGDLSQHNILVQDGKISGLIDWEFAGWFPEHWEYVNFLQRSRRHSDWREYAKVIFSQQYDSDLVDFLALSQFLHV